MDGSAVGRFILWEWWMRDVAWTPVQARVTRIEPKANEEIRVSFEYQAGSSRIPGQLTAQKGWTRNGKRLDYVGAQVPVFYDPKSPERHELGEARGAELWFFRGMAAVIGLPHALALGLVLSALRGRRAGLARKREEEIGWEH